ncbi:MAG: hypothetical protein ACKO0V_13100, partial [bacterium]
PIVGDRLTATGADITAIEKPLAYANIQIWVIYLAMALLTSIFCHIVTLAAFRYRWWKARESV